MVGDVNQLNNDTCGLKISLVMVQALELFLQWAVAAWLGTTVIWWFWCSCKW